MMPLMRCRKWISSTTTLTSLRYAHSRTKAAAAQQQVKATPPSASSQPAAGGYAVVGDQLRRSLDLSTVHIGHQIDIPYEQTIDSGHRTLWTSTFQIHDRLYTSTPFARTLQFAGQILPFSLVIFHTTSMAHVDQTREVLDLALERAVYVRPVYSGDTVKQVFTIKHLRTTSDARNTVVTVGCELFNERHQLVFSVDKLMLYPSLTHPYKISQAPSLPAKQLQSHLLEHIVYHAQSLRRDSNLAVLRPRQLILHAFSRPIGHSTNMALSTLFRWSHPTIYNDRRYGLDHLLVPGGLTLAATLSASSGELFECLHETLIRCAFINKCAPNEAISALTYIHSIRALQDHGLEEIEMTTLGIKDVDVSVELDQVSIPLELFSLDRRLIHSDVEEIVKNHCPALVGKIVVILHRKVVRQSPFSMQMSIPLL